MARPNALRALPPAWFRFTEPDDKGKYGDRWFVYDEGTVMRQPARALVELERDLGMPLVEAFNGFRNSTVIGELAVSWIGVRMVDPARAGDFDEYSPQIYMVEWSATEPEPAPKGEEPEATPQRPESNSTTKQDSSSTTSEITGTVALPVLPTVE